MHFWEIWKCEIARNARNMKKYIKYSEWSAFCNIQCRKQFSIEEFLIIFPKVWIRVKISLLVILRFQLCYVPKRYKFCIKISSLRTLLIKIQFRKRVNNGWRIFFFRSGTMSWLRWRRNGQIDAPRFTTITGTSVSRYLQLVMFCRHF